MRREWWSWDCFEHPSSGKRVLYLYRWRHPSGSGRSVATGRVIEPGDGRREIAGHLRGLRREARDFMARGLTS